MKILEKKDVLDGPKKEGTNHVTQNQLTETLWDKMFDLKKFYEFLMKKISEYNDVYGQDIWKDIENLRNQIWEWEVKTISETEVRRILKNLNSYLKTKREFLKEPFTQDIPYFRANIEDKEYYLGKIEDRSLTVQEFDKMQREIENHWSILSRSNRRKWEFWGWYWDVILSLTTWKVYDVEWEWEKWLEEDYKWKKYYSSWSWLSGAWNFYAGKWSLIYMPISRMDVKHPSLYLSDINGLKMTMCTSRWVIDEKLPTIIKSWKVNLWVDVVLLSQKNHLQQWNTRDLVNTIETRGKNLKDWPIYTYKVKYFDENLEEREISFTYKTNMDPNDINFGIIWRELFWIGRWFQVEETWSFIDKIVWIRKYKWKYVRLWQFWLIKEVFDEHPNSDMDKLYYDDIEIWNRNEIVHKKVEVEPLLSGVDLTKNFNWWIVSDAFAFKNFKNKVVLSEYDLDNICSEHGVEYDEKLKEDDVYHLVFEDDVSKYNKLFWMWWEIKMEFEYYVPKTIFEQFSVEYWKNFLSEKLKDKMLKSVDIHLLSDVAQKNIVLNYLRSHRNTVFTLQDSYDSWNCYPGTDRFVKTFGISGKITGKELLKHKDFEKMLAIYDFRKIFLKKVLWQSSH